MNPLSRSTVWLNLLMVIVATVLSVLIVEGALRLFPEGESRLDYRDAIRREGDGWGPGGFLREDFSGYVENGFGEGVRWQNNSAGFRSDREFEIPAPENSFRILSAGDSFTAGYRVGQEQTFSFLLESAMAARSGGPNVEVMITLIEHPLNGLRWLEDYGPVYRPDLVIVGITLGNDLSQVYHASPGGRSGPMDRDARIPGECLSARKGRSFSGPRWSDTPEYSKPKIFDSRLRRRFRRLFVTSSAEAPQTVISDHEEYENPRIFESHGLAYYLVDPPHPVQQAHGSFYSMLEAYKRSIEEQERPVLFVVFPQRFQVQPKDWDKTVEVYGLRESCFDLALPNRRILRWCQQLGLRCLDPTAAMLDAHLASGKSLYLPHHDMHWGAEGHRVMAEILLPAVDEWLGPSVGSD